MSDLPYCRISKHVRIKIITEDLSCHLPYLLGMTSGSTSSRIHFPVFDRLRAKMVCVPMPGILRRPLKSGGEIRSLLILDSNCGLTEEKLIWEVLTLCESSSPTITLVVPGLLSGISFPSSRLVGVLW